LFFVPDQHRVIDHPGRAQVHQGGARLLSRHRQIAQSLILQIKQHYGFTFKICLSNVGHIGITYEHFRLKIKYFRTFQTFRIYN
jgi:hypothetical protein